MPWLLQTKFLLLSVCVMCGNSATLGVLFSMSFVRLFAYTCQGICLFIVDVRFTNDSVASWLITTLCSASGRSCQSINYVYLFYRIYNGNIKNFTRNYF